MNQDANFRLKEAIIKCFIDEGFFRAGTARAGSLAAESEMLAKWLGQSYHAGMSWFVNSQEKRSDPRKLLEGAKSIICGLFNYFPPEQPDDGTFKIAKYALGQDYHHVVMDKLKRIEANMHELSGSCRTFATVDSGTFMDKPWAMRCGLGWIGKNGLLINREKGSFFFIGSIITDLDIEPGEAETDHCGTCRLCMDACPTGAIVSPGMIDARKCLSYLTIEHKGDHSQDVVNSASGWIFGCDTCQDVCPYNRCAESHNSPELSISGMLKAMTAKDWSGLDPEKFKALFSDSTVKRTGFPRLRRNIKTAGG